MKKFAGFTLVELLVTLALILILSGLAAPAFTNLFQDNRARLVTDQLRQLINLARTEAIRSGVTITICPSTDQQNCSTDWQAPIIVFTDSNRNRTIDHNDRVLRQLDLLRENETLQLRASSNKKYLQFNALGQPHGTFGNFTYCRDNLLSSARRLTINFVGRVRAHKDLDGDGIVDGTASSPIAC